MPGTPLSPQDHLDVMNLIASYALCIDSQDVEGYVDNFMPDGVLDSMSGASRGHDEIRARVTSWLDTGRAGPHLRHFVGLPQIHGEGDRCRARTYCVILDYDASRQIRVPLVGLYDDECVKVDGRWRFERRTIKGELEIENRLD